MEILIFLLRFYLKSRLRSEAVGIPLRTASAMGYAFITLLRSHRHRFVFIS
ncbi:hypothetical protein [Nostoc sp.]|uniref:hypothetical protein n=1 Tax=Nostoc sp. TaxID=1180 RepID=UPI002FF614E0